MINFDFPNNTEDYVHRIGRTARAEQTGTAYSFFTTGNAKQARELIDILKEAKQSVPPRLYNMLELSKQMHMSKSRQRYRVRDDKRRNEDRGGGPSMNGRSGGSSYGSRGGGGGGGGTTSWSEGGDKGYLGGLGKYNRKDSSTGDAGNGILDQNAGYGGAPVFSYNPSTNSITPNFMPPASGAPTSAPYGQYAPYQNGSAGAGYAAYQYSGAATGQAVLPTPPPPQPMYYAPPPPPPPPGQ